METLTYRQPRLVFLILMVLIATGLSSLLAIGRQEDPTITNLFATVTTAFPGAEPARVETLVTTEIEDELKQISEIDTISSVSSTGVLQIILMIAVLFGSFMLAKRMIDDKPDPRQRRAFKTVYTIDTVEAKLGDYQPVFTSYGQTIAARSVDLRSLVSGEIIAVNPKLRAGARIAKGEALVEIDEFNYRGALAEANANLQEAQARLLENEAQIALEQSKLESANEQLELAVTDLQRIESLKERQTATQQQVEARKLVVSQRKQSVALSENTLKVQQARIDQQKASLLRLQWKVDQAQRNLDSTTLVAPFSGIVRSSTAEIGRAITANDVVVSM